MKQLTTQQMIELFKSGDWKTLNEEHTRQFMNFMFGEEFMDSDDKGAIKQYEEQ